MNFNLVNYAVDFSFVRSMKGRLGTVDVFPCLHTKGQQIFLPKHNRFISPSEALRLQGFGEHTEIILKNVKTDRRAYHAAGNSMCVDLLQQLLRPIVDTLTANE